LVNGKKGSSILGFSLFHTKNHDIMDENECNGSESKQGVASKYEAWWPFLGLFLPEHTMRLVRNLHEVCPEE
jgi:hypothetical protein